MFKNTGYRSLLAISDLSLDEVESIYQSHKYPSFSKNLLNGHTVFTLFFEDSTRTLISFETAAKQLGANVVNISVKDSSINKGESIVDTIENIVVMNPAFIIIRSQYSDFFSKIPAHLLKKSRFINAGCGSFEHPTQAIVDYAVIRDYKGSFSNLNILICGDILNSRVARSDIRLFSAAGANVFLLGEQGDLPISGVAGYYKTFEDGLKYADVIILLRIQKERMSKKYISIEQYKNMYCLTKERIAIMKPNAIVMHPGPINRGIELCANVEDERIIPIQQTIRAVSVRQSLMNTLFYVVQ